MAIEQENEFEVGTNGGLMAGTMMFLFIETFKWLGLTKYDVLYIAGETVFTHTFTWYSALLAILVHAGISILWGVIFTFLITKFFNYRWWIFKSIFCSFCVFFFHLGILDDVFHYSKELHMYFLDMAIYLGGYVVYGFVIGIYLKTTLRNNY